MHLCILLLLGADQLVMPVVLLFLYLHSSEHVRLALLHLRFCVLSITRALRCLSACML